ncbi:MAG: YdeI/OmpD-associated family protein [bacterium]
MAASKNRLIAKQQVEAYFARAPEFAKPICYRLRELVLRVDPEIIEDWKWGPNYSKNGMVCGIGAFKKHVGLWFFKGALMKDPKKLFVQDTVEAKSMRKINFTSLDQVDEHVIALYIKEAVSLNMKGVKVTKEEIVVPKDFQSLLEKDKKMKEYFESLAYTHKKEYVRWIEEAKKEETRKRRLKKAIEILRDKMKER